VVLQCVRYTVQNNFFSSKADVEVEVTHNLDAILQCVHYVVGTDFLGVSLQVDSDAMVGSKGSSGESQNYTVVSNSVNETNNKKCMLESEHGSVSETGAVNR
jgi:hypothetical protein